MDPEIIRFYARGGEEFRLFNDGRPRLEYLRTLELLDRVLPAAPARLLDVGGGTGVYAARMFERGYVVDLIDPVIEHVLRAAEIAKERGLSEVLSARVRDARDLDAGDGVYDGVLMLGPLYHLVDRADRVRAWREGARVVRPGGVVAAAGISRFASLLDGLERGLLSDPVFRSVVDEDLRTGQHRNPDAEGQPVLFTTAYFHRPEELVDEAHEAGLRDAQLFAIEGPGWIVESIEDIPGQLYAARAVESEPSLMSATSHMLATGHCP